MAQKTQGQSQIKNNDMSTGFWSPPVVRSGANTINRALFTKTVDLAAAAVHDARSIAKYQKALNGARELLRVPRISSVVVHPDSDLAAQGKKCLLLNETVKAPAPETWGPVLREAVRLKELSVVPYKLELDYDYYSFLDIMSSILPEELHSEIPTGFNTAGHVAHLNLRDMYLPYKKVIADVLIDKNPHVKTVINKIDNVGKSSEFRTFNYEVLAGEDNLNVQVCENNCTFEFDYSKVYWNSKLEPEHTRLIKMFNPGEAVCDVMAGIGPFAVPAGKKGVFVWANDMNPESHKCLMHAIQQNKVSQFVRGFCEDGRTFIHKAADLNLEASTKGEHALILSKKRKVYKDSEGAPEPEPEPTRVPLPPTISHFIMNLPASAIEFVGFYRGVYAGHEALFEPKTETKLPLVHVHCFSFKADDDTPINDICERLTKYLGFPMRPGNPEVEGEVSIHNVRDVAPAKSMYCASFRLPRDIAFAPRD